MGGGAAAGEGGRASHPVRVGSVDPSIIPGKLADNEWFCFHRENKNGTLRLEKKVG